MSVTMSQDKAQAFTLPCGCIALTEADGRFEVRWCPHHRSLHGVIPCDFLKHSPEETRAYRKQRLP